jgi:hypothetical protein
LTSSLGYPDYGVIILGKSLDSFDVTQEIVVRSHLAWFAGAALAVVSALSANAGTIDKVKTRGRKDDVDWFQIVQWTHYALITAEELGVTQANVDEKLKSDNPGIRRLLGVEGSYGEGLGLTKDWAYRIIKGVGNYGEIFERNVGQGSPIKIARGLNALWNKGGLQYAPPIR